MTVALDDYYDEPEDCEPCPHVNLIETAGGGEECQDCGAYSWMGFRPPNGFDELTEGMTDDH